MMQQPKITSLLKKYFLLAALVPVIPMVASQDQCQPKNNPASPPRCSHRFFWATHKQPIPPLKKVEKQEQDLKKSDAQVSAASHRKSKSSLWGSTVSEEDFAPKRPITDFQQMDDPAALAAFLARQAAVVAFLAGQAAVYSSSRCCSTTSVAAGAISASSAETVSALSSASASSISQ